MFSIKKASSIIQEQVRNFISNSCYKKSLLIFKNKQAHIFEILQEQLALNNMKKIIDGGKDES